MDGIDSLVTRLPPDKHYTGESPATQGLAGFVCPRADSYGGRDGIISPGVAAVNGLVPRGMRKVSVRDVSKSADAAVACGATESAKYREYYNGPGKSASAQSQAQSQAQSPEPRQAQVRRTRPAPAREDSRMASAVAQLTRERDELIRKMAEMQASERKVRYEASRIPQTARGLGRGRGRGCGRIRPAAWGGRIERTELPEPAIPVRPSIPSRPVPGRARPQREVLSDPDDPGMFSKYADSPAGDDTLDGFYDSLAGAPAGTGETDAGTPEQPKTPVYVQRGPDAAAVPDAPRAREPQDAQVKSSGDARAADVAGETVRIVMSLPEEHLKVGGRHWECRVVGALHVGHGGRCAVLTVCDPAYSSELLAEMRPGEVVVLSESARTYCTYDGHCAKIYGEQGSQDFIAAFWLTLDGGRKGA